MGSYCSSVQFYASLVAPKHVGRSLLSLSCSVPFPLCPLDLSASSDPAIALLHGRRPPDEIFPPLTHSSSVKHFSIQNYGMYPSSSPSALLSSEKVLSTLLSSGSLEDPCLFVGGMDWGGRDPLPSAINSLAISKTLFQIHFSVP